MDQMYVDYKQIFIDILDEKFPDKKIKFLPLLQKEALSAIEVIDINKQIFANCYHKKILSNKHKSYKKSDIFKILDFQKKNKLNNSQLAKQFKLSRNTVSRWRKIFI